MQDPADTRPDFAMIYPNLATPRLGTQVVKVSDEFFGARDRMLSDQPAVFVPDKYDDHGKWMDGWETRRRRDGGHDWALIRLGVTGIIKGVDIDTSHFTGNFPPAAMLEGCHSATEPDDKTQWRPIVPASKLGPSASHYMAALATEPVNWLRLHIYPDGGVARLRVYGEALGDWEPADAKALHELSAMKNGGRILAYNNAHYGTVQALITDGRGQNMGDGWETRRRREPGHDWLIVALGRPGVIEAIEIDTAFFRGNYPDRCSLQAARIGDLPRDAIITDSQFWPVLMAEQKLNADHVHSFDSTSLTVLGAVSHVKLNIVPDGGVSRLRVFGRLVS
jgi:allantoicase